MLFDLREDPDMERNVAGGSRGVLDAIWNDYVLGEAGGPLPRYDMASPPGL